MEEEKLSKIYYDPNNPGSFGGIKRLHRAAETITLKKIKKWMQSQRTYTLHRPVTRKFPRNRVIAYDKDEVWNADLVFMDHYAHVNSGYKYILTIIDVLSKYAWALPLKDKNPKSVIAAFDTIKDRKCKFLHTDKGGEFMGVLFQDYLKSRGIKHYTTENEDIKACVVERFNRTLKGLMFRYFTHSGSYRYIDVLPKLMESYNRSFHRSIRMRPADVSSRDSITRAYANLYPNATPSPKAPINFKVGDRVRMAYHVDKFNRGFLPQWTEEIFTISEIVKRTPYVIYRVKDCKGEEVKGTHYAPELQKVDDTGIYMVEKVLRTRKRKGFPKEYLVKWFGYPASENSWVTNVIRKS